MPFSFSRSASTTSAPGSAAAESMVSTLPRQGDSTAAASGNWWRSQQVVIPAAAALLGTGAVVLLGRSAARAAALANDPNAAAFDGVVGPLRANRQHARAKAEEALQDAASAAGSNNQGGEAEDGTSANEHPRPSPWSLASWKTRFAAAFSPYLPTSVLLDMAPPNARFDLEFTEFVELPDATSAAVVELGVPVRGELRVHTYLDRTVRATVKLSAPSAGTPSAGLTTMSINSTTSSMPGGERLLGIPAAGAAGRSAVAPAARIEAPVVHDTVSSRRVAATGNQLQFIPPRCATVLLLAYDTTTADEVQPGVVCRECVLSPGTTAGAFRLSIMLDVVAAAQDVCVALQLPKRGELREAPAICRGVWGRPAGGAANEVQWLVGDVEPFRRPRQPHSGATAALDDDGDAASCVSSINSLNPGGILQCTWEYALPHDALAALSRPGSPAGGAEESVGTGTGTASSGSAGLRDRYSGVLPSVTLTYATPVSSSGLKVRRVNLETVLPDSVGVCSSPGYQAKCPRTGAVLADVQSSVSTRTLYSQTLVVESDL